jgi:isopropylmalate/homocitrate/citramalate synthase
MKMKIAEKLEEAGVREIEEGYSGIKKHAQFMKRLKHSGSKMRPGSYILAGGVNCKVDPVFGKIFFMTCANHLL